jgi:dephospho-CoA kinase
MLKIGITGGIGSGKSTVCSIFSHLGVPVYTADERARWLIGSSEKLRQEIIREFGQEAFKEGIYDRSYMAEQVFSDPERLKILNRLIHPVVAEDFLAWAGARSNECYILHEAAILFESGAYKLMDRTLLVDAPEELRIARIMKRDQTSRASVVLRMKNQWPTDKIRSMADRIINNDEKTLILPQILQIHSQLTEG